MEKINEIIAKSLNCKISDVTSEKRLKEDLNADSLKLADLFMAFGDEFNLDVDSISEEDLLNINTVKDIEELIKKYVK